MYSNSTFNEILKPLGGGLFKSSVKSVNGDKYNKGFDCWSHLVAMLHCQLSGLESLRGTCDSYNHHRNNHYHLNTGSLKRSTFSDANNNRSPIVFGKVLGDLIPQAQNRKLRTEAKEALHIIDSSPIPLTDKLLKECGSFNGRIKGMKLHVQYESTSGLPVYYEITKSNVNDITPAKTMPITKGGTYVFDLAYVDYKWWNDLIEENECTIVSRIKTNTAYEVEEETLYDNKVGVVADRMITLSSEMAKKVIKQKLRLVTVALDNNDPKLQPRKGGNRKKRLGSISIITNDLKSKPEDIADIYRKRWEIEIFFRWIKQHLKIKKFIGHSENAVVIQLITAIIAYVLLKIFNSAIKSSLTMHECSVLVRTSLFARPQTEYYLYKRRKIEKDELMKHQPTLDLGICYA